jgi:hypothetical protein
MVHEKIKERKRLFPEKEKPRREREKEKGGKEKRIKKIEGVVQMPEGRLVKACPGTKNPALVFKDGKFVKA